MAEKKEAISKTKAKVKKGPEESKAGQKGKDKNITQKQSSKPKSKIIRNEKSPGVPKPEEAHIKEEKPAEKGHKEVSRKKEGTKPIKKEEHVKEGESVKVKEKTPAEKIKEVPIEKIKFHGKKPLSPEERKKISLIIAKKKKKPKFLREEMYKVKKLKAVWRRRRGLDSKKAEEKRGKGEIPKVGYKKPNSIVGIDPSGYYPVLVHNYSELQALDPVKEAAIIARAIGRRKRNVIIKMANDLKIMILNPRRGEI